MTHLSKMSTTSAPKFLVRTQKPGGSLMEAGLPGALSPVDGADDTGCTGGKKTPFFVMMFHWRAAEHGLSFFTNVFACVKYT